MKRVLQMKTMAEQFGSKPDKMANEMMTAVLNLREKGAMQKMGQNLKPDDALGKSLFNEYFKHHENVYYAVSKKYGQKNADQFMKFGLFSGGDAMIGGGEAAIKSNAIADSLMKHYPDMGYESFEKAILMARVGDMADKGYGSTKIIKEVRKQMGNNVADDLFLKYGDDILSNTQVMKTMAKGSGRVGLRRILKAVPDPFAIV
jgi:hypothetical protein